jgi:hypothetical protein
VSVWRSMLVSVPATVPADDPSLRVSVPTNRPISVEYRLGGQTKEPLLLLDPYSGPVARPGNDSCARESTRNRLRVRLRVVRGWAAFRLRPQPVTQ